MQVQHTPTTEATPSLLRFARPRLQADVKNFPITMQGEHDFRGLAPRESASTLGARNCSREGSLRANGSKRQREEHPTRPADRTQRLRPMRRRNSLQRPLYCQPAGTLLSRRPKLQGILVQSPGNSGHLAIEMLTLPCLRQLSPLPVSRAMRRRPTLASRATCGRWIRDIWKI